MEVERHNKTPLEIERSIPGALPARARNNIGWAIRDARLAQVDDLRAMTDGQIMTSVRSAGRTQGIGRITLARIRDFFPVNA
ncbi:MAG: hypothetical protein ACD_50C00248G0002 [uncultured bacterium]|nr:MAG: hypothetical protein ACD_50C00248G0002 [uncultured bacterium]KKR16312.1 MAG: hypothetical protein UT46_C0006G0005 [Candidatus Levybacteria bacterium GW2011_GWA1_39_34]KKR50830.1 MAG: hypothetical protein UT87_C0011G0008 [Candidatus Levybacteria bacterium GW2011_GWC1_40_19]KKR71862.1 MAG: hypothetical protein UU15_C0040G0002 [Candidatus Levybacteria bacterium GW2011_GWC2_40_7]KKR95267.1 MAG: hypothetical protein UU45_C0003G0053 [Candidatus Levybacteria bacterium GW2011_GWA2_41_15]KKS017